MKKFIDKFKIPTLLGLSIIFLGIISGLYLVLREQTFLSQATPNLTPQNVTLTNLTEDSITISWQTNLSATSFITYGQTSPGEQTALDDRDSPPGGGPKPRLIHYVTLKKLLPKTSYQFKIISGKLASDVQRFETASPLTNQTGFTPVIGSVLDDNIPLTNGIAYLFIPDTITQSSLVKEGGNFLIPLSKVRKNDLSDYQPTEGTVAKLTISSDKGIANILFKLKADSIPLSPIKLGQNIDLTTPEQSPQPSPTNKDLDKYDLNDDGKINAADNAIVLQNFGKNPKDKKTDLNGDGVVNQKDLDLMAQKIKELGSQ